MAIGSMLALNGAPPPPREWPQARAETVHAGLPAQVVDPRCRIVGRQDRRHETCADVSAKCTGIGSRRRASERAPTTASRGTSGQVGFLEGSAERFRAGEPDAWKRCSQGGANRATARLNRGRPTKTRPAIYPTLR